jgi:hypothetical protein
MATARARPHVDVIITAPHAVPITDNDQSADTVGHGAKAFLCFLSTGPSSG